MTHKRTFGLEKRPIGAVGLGCMSFGGALYGPADDAESLRAMARALELGCDFWDTANIYGDGRSETLLGRFFGEDPTRRGKVVLASKFGIKFDADGRRSFSNAPDYMRSCLDASLKRLGVERIDLYYVHRKEPNTPIEETVAALAREVEAGKIGAIGLSEVAPDTLRRACAVHPIAAVQSEYSLWTRAPELGLLDACRELGTTFVAFSPLGRGFFGGLLRDPATLEKGDFRVSNPRFAGGNWPRNLAALDRFVALAKEWGLTPPQLAVAWTLAKGEHVVPIPGTRYEAHLVENVSAENVALTPQQLAALEKALPVGFAAGDRYTDAQWGGVERFS